MAFESQQSDFVVKAAAVTGETTIGTDDAMAWYNETNRIPAHRATYSLRRHFFDALIFGYCCRDFSISHGFPEWDLAHYFQDFLSERSEVLHPVFRSEIGLSSAEIHVQPPAGFLQHRWQRRFMA